MFIQSTFKCKNIGTYIQIYGYYLYEKIQFLNKVEF